MRRIVAVVLIVAAIALAPLALALYALAQGGRLIASAGGPADLLPIPSFWYVIPAIAALVAVVVAVWLLWKERSSSSSEYDRTTSLAGDPVRTVNRWLESESEYLAQLGRVVGGGEHVEARARLAAYRRAAALQESASRAILSIGSSPLVEAFSRWRTARTTLDDCVRRWAGRPIPTPMNSMGDSVRLETEADRLDSEDFLSVFNGAVGAVEDIRTALANVEMRQVPTRPL